jgi:hypothetical protein
LFLQAREANEVEEVKENQSNKILAAACFRALVLYFIHFLYPQPPLPPLHSPVPKDGNDVADRVIDALPTPSGLKYPVKRELSHDP